MGISSYPAGFGLAGHDPFSAVAGVSPSTALATAFDPGLRLYPIVEGDLVAVHPVDQEVALRLGVPLGSIASSPFVGLDMKRLKRASSASMQATVDDVVRVALQPLVAARDIDLLGSPLADDADGRPFFFVDYRNLRIPSSAAPRQLSVGA